MQVHVETGDVDRFVEVPDNLTREEAHIQAATIAVSEATEDQSLSILVSSTCPDGGEDQYSFIGVILERLGYREENGRWLPPESKEANG